MMNGAVQSVNDANERSRQMLQPYQFLWLAHWKGTDYDAARETSSFNASVSEELDCVPRIYGLSKGLEASSRSANGLGSMKCRTSEIGDDFIKEARKRVGQEIIFSSLFKDGQYADGVEALSPELAQTIERSKAVHNRIGIPSSGCHSVEKDASDSPPKGMRICSARKDSLFRVNPLQERFVEPSSHSLPYKFAFEVDKFDKGKAAMSVGSRHKSADMRILDNEQYAQSDNTADECFMESNSCDRSLSSMNRGWFMEMLRSSGIRLFPSQSNSSEEYETTKPHGDCCSQLKLQKCVHGLGTKRICTPVDVSGGTLITKKIVVNSFKENDAFRCGRDFTKISGSMSGDLHSILTFFGQNNGTAKLQCRGCLNDSEVNEYIGDVKASKVTIRTEILDGTDTISMNSFKDNESKKNLHPASNSTASAKTSKMVSNEVVPPNRNNKLQVKYNSSIDEFRNADGGSRWVKRLKLSSPNSCIRGLNSSKIYSNLYHEERSKLFSDIPKIKTTSSKPNIQKHHCEKSLESIEKADEKGKALLVSHGWIRRWRRIKSKEKSQVEATCEVEKFRRGQFPSIAAMALMSKALTCFQQYELQKKGCCTVWNTRRL